MAHADPEPNDRRDWLGLLSRAPHARLMALAEAAGITAQPATDLRAAEIGSVMVRGRIGGTGAPFNLGEVTVTRASVALPDGTVGHGTVQGRHRGAARMVAVIDALMQTGARPGLEQSVLGPLRSEMAGRATARAEHAAATKVEFFTLVRGED